MSRKLERLLFRTASVWQAISGLLTIFVYANFFRSHGPEVIELPIFQLEAIHSLTSSIYIFIVSYGIFFVLAGMFNFYLSYKLQDNRIEVKIPVYLLVVGLAAYLTMDFISGILCIVAGLLALSKNKSIALFKGNHLKKSIKGSKNLTSASYL